MSRIIRRLDEALAVRQQRAMTPRSAALASPRAIPLTVRYALLWVRYGDHAVLFAAAVFLVTLAGGVARRPSYRASSTVRIAGEDVRDEWDLLKDEARGADFEEQIRSRAILEPALRALQLFPPARGRARWFTVGAARDADERQALARAVEAFQRRLTVERIRHSGILRVTVAAPTPSEAASGADAVVRSLLDYHRRLAITRTERQLHAIDQELARLSLEQLEAFRSEIAVESTSLHELSRQLAAVDAKLSQVASRYMADTPIVLQVRREKDALEDMLAKRTAERSQALQDDRARRHPSLSTVPGPTAATLDALIDYAKERSQELLKLRGDAQLALATWRQSSAAFGQLSILDEALPPPGRPLWAQILLALAGACAVSMLALAVLPVALGLSDRKARGARSAARALLERLMPVPVPDGAGETAIVRGTARWVPPSLGKPADEVLHHRALDDAFPAP